MRGRKRKPTVLKLMTGDAGGRGMNEDEPKPKRIIPAPPSHLSPEEMVHWGRFSTVLDRMGVLTEADGFALEQLCILYQEMVELRQLIRDGDRFAGTATMPRPHPAVAMRADADRRFHAYLSDFGLTPAARARLVADIPDDDDAAAKYIKKAR